MKFHKVILEYFLFNIQKTNINLLLKVHKYLVFS